MHTMQEMEVRVRRLEIELQDLQRRLQAMQHKLGQVAEDNPRQFQDDSVGRLLVRAQSVGIITASAGNTLGTGTARFLKVIGGARFKTQPLIEGDVTVDVVNDTGSPTVDKEYLILAMVDGLWTCLIGDCATMSPAIAPDPPAS